MRIDRLEVRDFLGLRGEVTLDLDAPLTVLHAPNGTGKTSLCEAIEWGLLGTVERLGIRSRKEHSQVACRFSASPRPRVAMDLSLPSGPLHLERTPDGLTWRTTHAEGTTDSGLFCRIAPGAGPGALPTQAANRWRADWIHGTRFLAGEDLAVLLEEDADAPNRGRILLAQIFGVAEMERRERLLEAFLEEPPSLRTLVREHDAAQRAVEMARMRVEEARKGTASSRARQVLRQALDTVEPLKTELSPALVTALNHLEDAVRIIESEDGVTVRGDVAPTPLLVLESALAERVKVRRSLSRRIRYWKNVEATATSALLRTRAARLSHMRAQLEPLQDSVSAIFRRAQVNRVFDGIVTVTNDAEGTLGWRAATGDASFQTKALSLGQRQDLALAIFLARARSLGGTFILDEPLAHLDDLNKVALLDILRVLVTEPGSRIHLVLTTASRRLARHLEEKMHAVPGFGGRPPLRVHTLEGNARIGTRVG